MADLLARRERFAVVGSTNDVVRGWLADGTPEVCLAVADEQTAGRGREGRTWQAPPGGALLLCPAGKIEPDPALFPDAVDHLDQWSESIELFARLVPSLTIVPAVISHVLSPHALRHPLAKLRHTSADQQWLAATLQLIFPSLKRDAVRVAFGEPLQRDGAPVSALLLADVRRIMQRAYAAAQQ